MEILGLQNTIPGIKNKNEFMSKSDSAGEYSLEDGLEKNTQTEEQKEKKH